MSVHEWVPLCRPRSEECSRIRVKNDDDDDDDDLVVYISFNINLGLLRS